MNTTALRKLVNKLKDVAHLTADTKAKLLKGELSFTETKDGRYLLEGFITIDLETGQISVCNAGGMRLAVLNDEEIVLGKTDTLTISNILIALPVELN